MRKRKSRNRNYLIPKFEVTAEGFTLCKDHSEYESLKNSTYDFVLNFLTFKNLTCKSCEHYQNDNCFFPKAEILKIMDDMSFFTNQFICYICKRKIRNIFTVLKQFKEEKKFIISNFLICHKCLKISQREDHRRLFSNSARLCLMYSLINLLGIIGFISIFPFLLGPSAIMDSFLVIIIFIPTMSYFFIHYAKLSLRYYSATRNFENLC